LSLPGTIYLHKKLVFHDGATGTKYLILLNETQREDPFLFVKTTSQKKDKPETPGCIRQRNLFFVPARKTYFISDTWVQLHDIYPISPQQIKSNPDIQITGALKPQITQAVGDCLLDCQKEDLPPIIINLLRPPMHDALVRLREKFRKK
jgi:hypothetical protein